MACANVRDDELRVREVVLADTATTVRFTMEYPKGQWFRFVASSYLIGEDGKRYPMRSAEGISLDSWVQSPESGTTDFTMHFEPMPKQTKIFDFIEGENLYAFAVLGIHDTRYKPKTPTLEELYKANPYMLPTNWFKTDTITVRGRIEGYDAEQMGFTSMECYYEDVFDKESVTLVAEIQPDGTFEKRFRASYPVMQRFYSSEGKVDWSGVCFYARPGDTIDITVRPNEQGQLECYYNSGSSKEVQHWLKSNSCFLSSIFRPLSMFRGKFGEARPLADSLWQKALQRVNWVGRREHFTPLEMQLALADLQVQFAYSLMNFALYKEDDLMKQELRDGIYYTEITDSAEWRLLFDASSYSPLHRLDFDNPMLLSSRDYSILLNRIQYAKPVTEAQYKGMIDEAGGYIVNAEHEMQEAMNGYEALRSLLGTADHNTLMAQLCVYNNMLSNFNSWRHSEETIPVILADTTRSEAEKQASVDELASLSKLYPFYLSTYSIPYVHQKAEQFYAERMAQTEFSTPLPDVPIAEVIRRLTAKHSGKFLIIDFWGMGCGPCRAAIQSSKEKRAKVRERDDVKLVFIAEERTAEGSDAYHKYVSEWLADEETLCVTYADFTRLQELFRFNGIPHYETITPEGRMVRDDLRINGFYNFDYELKRLLEKLK